MNHLVGGLFYRGNVQIKGALSMAMAAAKRTVAGLSEAGLRRNAAGLTEASYRGIIVPSANAAEAAVVEDLDIIAVDSIAQTAAFLTGDLEIEPTPSRLDQLFEELSNYEEDFADVHGQEMSKRAVTIAAAGGHNLLTFGPITPTASSCSIQETAF